ncbi:MAG: ferredoxin family protein [Acidobacteriia bacterium]|nr:ferredoxin family protein [Terriglobia bacterium]
MIPYSQLSPDAQIEILEGRLAIVKDLCKGCAFCIEFCPKHVLVEAKDFNKKGYHPPAVKDAMACSDCKLCEYYCPEFAIYTPAGAAEKKASAKATGQKEVARS